jgi:hypothetical protein
MGLIVDSGIKPPNAGTLVLQNEFESKAVEPCLSYE